MSQGQFSALSKGHLFTDETHKNRNSGSLESFDYHQVTLDKAAYQKKLREKLDAKEEKRSHIDFYPSEQQTELDQILVTSEEESKDLIENLKSETFDMI